MFVIRRLGLYAFGEGITYEPMGFSEPWMWHVSMTII